MAAKDQLAVFMDPGEFSQLLAATYALCPRKVLEWGSGGSTKALLERCEFIEHYVSIEHDALWFEKVRSLVRDPRLRLEHVPADRPLQIAKPKQKETESWYALAEADPSVMKSYVEFPRQLGITFDMILVDGRGRRHCVREGFELLRPGGLLVVHDAQRKEYHDALHAVGRPRFLEPWKQGQICLLHKE